MDNKSIIIFGPPRSGTTWLASIIEQAGYHIIHEPDNGKNNFSGLALLNNLRRFPYFNESENPNALIQLFNTALEGPFHPSDSLVNTMLNKVAGQDKNTIEKSLLNNGTYHVKKSFLTNKLVNLLPSKIKKSDQPRVIKSVHSFLSIPFLIRHLDFIPLIIVRHPCAIIHSMNSIGMPDIDRQIFTDPNLRNDFLEPYMDEISMLKTDNEFAGLQMGIFHFVLKTYIKKYNFIWVKHENLVFDPINNFHKLFTDLKLEWTKDIEKKLIEKNKEGSGYDLNRDLSTVNEKWKLKLRKNEIEEIYKGYSIFADLFY
ncbi:MAG TPA: sulfotransferase [Bacteroidales bacterium]|nr:sulfotransferase [Bacteroidales bacterium]HRX98022.1 sulfotransferase [Bacteroidales bacterium]